MQSATSICVRCYGAIRGQSFGPGIGGCPGPTRSLAAFIAERLYDAKMDPAAVLATTGMQRGHWFQRIDVIRVRI